jgi:hypothetical protein
MHHNEYLPLSNSRLGVAKKSSKPPFVAPSGGFAPAATRVYPSCGLSLGAIIQSDSLPYLVVPAACLSTFLPARTYRTHDMVCLRAGTTS